MRKSVLCAKDLSVCYQSEWWSGRPTDGEENVRICFLFSFFLVNVGTEV